MPRPPTTTGYTSPAAATADSPADDAGSHGVGTGGGNKAARRIRFDPILLLICGVILAFLGANGLMVWFATQSPATLVTEDYYEASKRWNAVMDSERASNATGWRVEPGAAQLSGLRLRIVDAAGRPVSGAAGQASAYRPDNAALDQSLAWREAPEGGGWYELRFARPSKGRWNITLNLRRGDDRFQKTLRHVAP